MTLFIIIKAIFLLQVFYYVNGDVSCLTSNCICKTQTAVCTGNNLTYIPRFPKTIRVVTITNANLSHIPENGLFNLTFNYIVKLILINNNINHIHPSVFRNVTHIIKLQISNEQALNIYNVMEVLDNMNKHSLKSLYLPYNGWESIPNDMFNSFEDSKIKYLHLGGNKFQFINGSIFSTVPKFLYLDLEQNLIDKVSMKGLQQVQELNLAHNKIVLIPEWCDHVSNSYVPILKTLHLNSNYITRLSTFKCLPRLSFLSLEDNSIEEIPEDSFSNLFSLKELNLKSAGNRIKRIENNAFNLSRLETLTIGDCFYHFDQLDSSALLQFFALVPNLQILNMANNPLPSDTNSMSLLFKPISKIRKLHLDSCKLYQLPICVFSNFHYLDELTLRGNKLSNWGNGNDVFGNLTSIKHLDISGNRINIINETSFPVHLLVSMKTLNLAYNPYYCICDQMWFVDWLRRTHITVYGYPAKYKCVQPADMSNTLLEDYKPDVKSCTPWNPLFTIIISTSASVVFLIILFLTVLKCHTNIKNYIYLLRLYSYRKRGYAPITDSDDFEYHAFVVYYDADRLWVHNKFVKKLEKEEGVRLCIHHRDFEVGETISGNIDNFLKKSWKVVVIMSNDFAKSEWCQWEVDIVQERRRRLGRDVFLLVMLKNITSKYMTSPLRTLLDSTPHLKYPHGVGEDIFWKAAIESLRKPIGNPPVSVF